MGERMREREKLAESFMVVGPTLNLKLLKQTQQKVSQCITLSNLLSNQYAGEAVAQYPTALPPDIPGSIAMFTIPKGVSFRCKGKPNREKCFSFAVTSRSGMTFYGTSLVFYRRVSKKMLARVTDDNYLPLDDQTEIFATYSLCFLSRTPVMSTLRRVLCDLYTSVVRCNMGDAAIVSYIRYFIDRVCNPPPNVSLEFSLPSGQAHVLTTPRRSPFQPSDISLGSIFMCLDIPNVLHAVNCLLQEQRILVVSRQRSLLFSVCYALLQFIWPFQWKYTFIPVLPDRLLSFIRSQRPYLLGLHPRHLRRPDGSDNTDGLVVLDLDQNRITMPMSVLPMPEDEVTRTKSVLSLLLQNDLSQFDNIDFIPSNFPPRLPHFDTLIRLTFLDLLYRLFASVKNNLIEISRGKPRLVYFKIQHFVSEKESEGRWDEQQSKWSREKARAFYLCVCKKPIFWQFYQGEDVFAFLEHWGRFVAQYGTGKASSRSSISKEGGKSYISSGAGTSKQKLRVACMMAYVKKQLRLRSAYHFCVKHESVSFGREMEMEEEIEPEGKVSGGGRLPSEDRLSQTSSRPSPTTRRHGRRRSTPQQRISTPSPPPQQLSPRSPQLSSSSLPRILQDGSYEHEFPIDLNLAYEKAPEDTKVPAYVESEVAVQLRKMWRKHRPWIPDLSRNEKTSSTFLFPRVSFAGSEKFQKAEHLIHSLICSKSVGGDDTVDDGNMFFEYFDDLFAAGTCLSDFSFRQRLVRLLVNKVNKSSEQPVLVGLATLRLLAGLLGRMLVQCREIADHECSGSLVDIMHSFASTTTDSVLHYFDPTVENPGGKTNLKFLADFLLTDPIWQEEDLWIGRIAVKLNDARNASKPHAKEDSTSVEEAALCKALEEEVKNMFSLQVSEQKIDSLLQYFVEKTGIPESYLHSIGGTSSLPRRNTESGMFFLGCPSHSLGHELVTLLEGPLSVGTKECSEGELIVDTDTLSDTIFYVARGSVIVTRPTGNPSEIRQGGMFGEMCILDLKAKAAVVARAGHAGATLRCISREKLLIVFESRPNLMCGVVSHLAVILSEALKNCGKIQKVADVTELVIDTKDAILSFAGVSIKSKLFKMGGTIQFFSSCFSFNNEDRGSKKTKKSSSKREIFEFMTLSLVAGNRRSKKEVVIYDRSRQAEFSIKFASVSQAEEFGEHLRRQTTREETRSSPPVLSLTNVQGATRRELFSSRGLHTPPILQLSDEDWKYLLDVTQCITYNRGDVMIEEGSKARKLIQIGSGTVRVVKYLPGDGSKSSDDSSEDWENTSSFNTSSGTVPAEEKVLGCMGFGEILGVINFIHEDGATATVIADDKVDAYVLEGAAVDFLISTRMGFGGRFHNFLCLELIDCLKQRLTVEKDSDGS